MEDKGDLSNAGACVLEGTVAGVLESQGMGKVDKEASTQRVRLVPSTGQGTSLLTVS